MIPVAAILGVQYRTCQTKVVQSMGRISIGSKYHIHALDSLEGQSDANSALAR